MILTTSSVHAMTFDSLKRLIQDKRIASIETLLPYLPESYRTKYTLMFQSRSLHGSSFKDPRVLIFGEDASLIVSFNGDPLEKAFDALETMEFNKTTKEFHYNEIIFTKDAPSKNQTDIKPDSQVSISESNPEKCLKCHGHPARPLWDTWPIWPGAYGERYHSALSPKEKEGISSFLANQPTHPRYKHLLRPEVFADQETFIPSHENKYNGRQKISPNEELSSLLSEMNSQRIVKIVRTSHNFDFYGYTLLASLDPECGETEEFVPEQFRAAFAGKRKDFYTRSDNSNEEQLRLKRIRSVSLKDSADSSPKSETVSLNSFRFLAENGLGISTDQWTTALEVGTFDFTAPRSVETEIEQQLLAILTPYDPTLTQLASLRRVSSSDKYCSYLKKKSVSILSSLPSNSFSTGSFKTGLVSQPTLVKSCASCHDGEVGPSIPFDQPKTLASLLSKGKYPRGNLMNEISYRISRAAGADRMPRGVNISEEEKQSLEKYFLDLKSSTEVSF